jgi:hypothetical protein
MTKAKNPRNIGEVPITAENYARIERIANGLLSRGTPLPPQLTGWMQAAERHYGSMSYQQQQATLAQLDRARVDVQRFDATTDAALGRIAADKFFHDRTRGMAGELEGVDAKRLREIAENKTLVKETRQPVRNAAGATVADPWSKKQQYETKRTESRKYTDDDSRRASLVLAFGKHEAERVTNGSDALSGGFGDDIPEHRLNDTTHAGGDVARAMLEVESKASIGESLPTTEYQSLDKGQYE